MYIVNITFIELSILLKCAISLILVVNETKQPILFKVPMAFHWILLFWSWEFMRIHWQHKSDLPQKS